MKRNLYIYLQLNNFKKVVKHFDEVALKHLHITQQIILVTGFQNLMILVSYTYVAEKQKWISWKRLIKIKSGVFKILAFEMLANTKWCSSPTYTDFPCLTCMLILSFLWSWAWKWSSPLALHVICLILFFNYMQSIQFIFCWTTMP